MAEVVPIIEWQEDRQRTPQEVVDRLQELIDNDRIESILVIYQGKDYTGYMPGSEKRGLTKASILWIVEQFKYWWTISAFED